MTKIIRQEAIVLSQTEYSVRVSMACRSACAACHAKSACTSMDQQEKIIDVPLIKNDHFEEGEQVWVAMNQQMGLKAVLYAYLLPFFLFLISLLTCIQFIQNEVVCAGISLSIILIYYFFLYIMRSKLSNSFTFVLQKTDHHV